MKYKLNLSNYDQKWLLTKYQRLSVSQKNGIDVISGALDFVATYADIKIQDTYQIRIELQSSSVSDLPIVIETGGRIKNIAKTRNIPIIDLHTNSNGTACLCLRLEESTFFPDRFSISVFMEKLVEPFFYAQSYYEDYNTWPWDTYSHGVLGWLEWYYDQKHHTLNETEMFLEQLKNSKDWNQISFEIRGVKCIKGHHDCICGSKKRYRNCHEKVFRGLWELQHNIRRFGINI